MANILYFTMGKVPIIPILKRLPEYYHMELNENDYILVKRYLKGFKKNIEGKYLIKVKKDVMAQFINTLQLSLDHNLNDFVASVLFTIGIETI